MTTSTITRGKKVAKLHYSNELYSISLFLNNGETIIHRHAGKKWKSAKTALKKILEFINE